MTHTLSFFLTIFFVLNFKSVAQTTEERPHFDLKKDLLLAQFDCKTDVDDLHSVAALYSLLENAAFKTLNYFAVAGTYGVQNGLYVPPNPLFHKAFGDLWVDAHSERKKAIEEVFQLAKKTLLQQGTIWIAEAGQSDFSALVVKRLLKENFPFSIKKRIHIVQHSKWNEEVTSPEVLPFLKKNISYHKIPDGNTLNNGSPCFRTPGFQKWNAIQNQSILDVWRSAVLLAHKYNGKEGRYNNEAIASKGLDFSDLSEVCWILELNPLKDTEAFFNRYIFEKK